MSSQRKPNRYGCIKCGTPFEIYPPDDMHIIASRDSKVCETREAITMNYTCKECGSVNTLHWCRRRSHHDLYP